MRKFSRILLLVTAGCRAYTPGELVESGRGRQSWTVGMAHNETFRHVYEVARDNVSIADMELQSWPDIGQHRIIWHNPSSIRRALAVVYIDGWGEGSMITTWHASPWAREQYIDPIVAGLRDRGHDLIDVEFPKSE